jgi:hypothetical protein
MELSYAGQKQEQGMNLLRHLFHSCRSYNFYLISHIENYTKYSHILVLFNFCHQQQKQGGQVA